MVALYVISSFSLAIILILYLVNTLKIINSKYQIFKTYKTSPLYYIMIIFFTIIILLLLLLGWNDKYYIIFAFYLAQTVMLVLYLVYYFLTIKLLNKKTVKIADFKIIDFKKKIEQCNIKIDREKIKNKQMQLLNDKYVLANQLIESVKPQTYFHVIAEAIVFNETNIKLFNIKQNKIVYKLSLYLFWDIQNKEV